MAHRSLGSLIRHIRTLGDASSPDQSDAQLLERFAARRDEDAFTALLERHGPMVFGVCRRVLRHEQDAEDAFQATFLVLARKAGSRGWRVSVGTWLYAVARRVALKARTLAARRRARHTGMVDDVAAEPAGESPWHELRPILDEELNRLPEKYRTPLVLCYLEGKTNEEAARQLGRPVGTVWYQLSRGRELLKGRLSRRGVGLSAVALGAVINQNATAAVPAALLALTRQASLVEAGPAAPVAALVKEVVHDMLLTKLKRAVAMVLVLCVAGLGAGAVASLAKSGSEPVTVNRPFAASSDAPTTTPEKKTEKEQEKGKDNGTTEPASASLDKNPDKEKEDAKGKTEPASAPLEARLVARQDTYVLDRGGRSAEEYATQVRAAARAGKPLPTPRVELTLELRNTGDTEIKILVGGDGSDVMLDLQGPGAVRVRPNIASTFEYRASDVVAVAPGKSHVLTVSNLSFGHRGTSDTAYWTRPGDYTLTATYHTMVSPMPKGARKAPDFLPNFGHVAATSAPIKLKVIEPKQATDEPKPKESGKMEPASAPLEARLAAKQDTYTLDRGGQSAEEYARQVRAAANRGVPLPTPRVQLTLELRNTGDKEIKILVGGDGSRVMLDLQGPGAVSIRPNTPVTADYRASDVVAIAPGKSHVLTLSNLSFGFRGPSHLAYWTKAGEYTLTATYHTMVSPMPQGALKAPSFLPDFGHVSATSATIKLKVIDKQ